MQQLSLGDYRGNRDTLNAALGQENATLNGAMGMAAGMAQQGLSGVSRRLAMRQSQADSLTTQLALEDFKARLMADANDQKAMDEQAMGEEQEAMDAETLSGREAAMTDWFANVLQSYEPDSPEYKQAKRAMDMIVKRKRGGLAADKAYLDYIEEYGINEPLNQGTLGSLGVRYEGGNPKDQKPRKYPKRNGIDSEYDDDGE